MFYKVFSLLFVVTTLARADLVPTALNVEHISIGAGIDVEAKQLIERIIAAEVTGDRVETYVAKRGLGLEGESTTCVDLRSHEDLKRVSRLVARVASKAKLVRVTEQDECK